MEGKEGCFPDSKQNWAGRGEWRDVFCQCHTLCHLQAARTSALAQLRAQGTERRLTQDQLAQPIFQMKNVSPSWVPLRSRHWRRPVVMDSLTWIATRPASTRSGDRGPPGWALPAQAVPFPLGQDAQCGLGAHGGRQGIPLRGRHPPPWESLWGRSGGLHRQGLAGAWGGVLGRRRGSTQCLWEKHPLPPPSTGSST